MQGRILIATLKIGAAQVGTCNSIPGRELGVLHISIHFHEIHLVCCFFYDYTDAPTKTEKSLCDHFFFGLFYVSIFLGITIILYLLSCEPLPCLTHWPSCRPALKLFEFSSATVFDAILLHSSLLQANSRSNLLVKALNHSRSSLIHLNTVRNRKLKFFQFWLRAASHLPDYTACASELEDVASQPFQLETN